MIWKTQPSSHHRFTGGAVSAWIRNQIHIICIIRSTLQIKNITTKKLSKMVFQECLKFQLFSGRISDNDLTSFRKIPISASDLMFGLVAGIPEHEWGAVWLLAQVPQLDRPVQGAGEHQLSISLATQHKEYIPLEINPQPSFLGCRVSWTGNKFLWYHFRSHQKIKRPAILFEI